MKNSLYSDEFFEVVISTKYLFFQGLEYIGDVRNIVRNPEIYSTKGRRNVLGRCLLSSNCDQIFQRIQGSRKLYLSNTGSKH